MIKYLIDNKLITTDNIQYVVYSSLNVDKHYFNSFIDEAYSIKDGYEKLKVNCMIGSLKPATRENFKTLAIGTDLNTIYHHYLGAKASFIENFDIDNVRYYHVYEKYESKCEETETPIYNMVIELEIINLYELYKEINNKGGTILDVNTDCCVCTFKDNKVPFELDDTGNIKGYYHDKEEKVYKYRLEEKSDRLKCQMLPKWQRTQKYEYKQAEWNITNDTTDNDFKPLVKQILDSKKSINIDGRAGVGKSFFIKNLHKEMDERKLKYISLGPTNKSCRIINGITICKFIASFKMKSFLDGKYDYIFIDEISMVQEIYYKFFIYLKRSNPKIKFIIAGDFQQLTPVKDRVKKCDYKNSLALHDLCDGNKLQLTKCRRSDDTLFNMLLPENINNINKNTFSNHFTNQHISFTNAKRIEINKRMMDQVVRQKKKMPLRLNKLDYDQNSQNVELLSGMPIIARINAKDFDICNNELFTITKINKEFIFIQDESDKQIEIPIDKFQKFFYVAYCITTHKSQGSTFNHGYTIHEYDKFDIRLKYVALSRSTDIKNINIV